jgi:hypothetical protein
LLFYFNAVLLRRKAEIKDQLNFSAVSKVRAGRVLGRCHAALQQHALSVSAFDAAAELMARRGRFLLSELLAIRCRARAGHASEGSGSGSGLHWDEFTRKKRLAEVVGRMQGLREPLWSGCFPRANDPPPP